MDWELMVTAAGILAYFIALFLQWGRLRPSFTRRSTLKTDLEILRILKELGHPSTENVRKYVDDAIANIYVSREPPKRLWVHDWTLFVTGFAFTLGFSAWTWYLVRDGFSGWAIVTGFFAFTGVIWIAVSLSEPTVETSQGRKSPKTVRHKMPMKIALVSPYDFAYPGGVVNHISELERHFTQMGHEVKVIAPASRAINTFGDRFIPIGKPRPIPSSGSIIRVTISLRLASSIKEVLQREKFDIIHLHEPFMPMLCSAILRFSDSINIGTFHAGDGKPDYNWGKPISTWMIRRRLHKLDGRIAVSKPAMNFASKYVPGYFNIIPNGVDIEHFSPNASPIEAFCDGKQNILFVGRLEHRKGLNHLLKAYLKVKQEMLNSRLIIVGPGTMLRKKYEKWVKRNRLADVIFVGFVSYDELPRYYKTADVFCAPTTGRESFGIVLLEAMAVGRPVVVSNIDSYASVVTHGKEGLLVPPKDSQALAQTLLTVLGDEALQQRLGDSGRKTAEQYSWNRIAQRVFDYYLEVLSNLERKEFARRQSIGMQPNSST